VRILAALAYLIVVAANLWLQNRLMLRRVRNLKPGAWETLARSSLGIAALLLQFTGFWLLTGRFPVYLILLLVAGSLVAAVLHELLGAIGGFGLQETKEKVAALGAIWGAQNKIVGCLMGIFGLVFISAQTIGSLWIYFSHPYGSDAVVGWIALFQFILPRLVTLPIELAVIWPIVTSEFVDNDLRNSHLSAQFVSMVNATIIFVYPFTLFREQMAAAVGQVPPLWVLLSIPVFLFMVLGLLPFFLGTYKFRNQAGSLIGWRRQWLSEALPILRLPGELRAEALDEKLRQLRDEIASRIDENRLLKMYREYFPDEISSDEPLDVEPQPALIAERSAVEPGAAEAALVVNPEHAETQVTSGTRPLSEMTRIRRAVDYVRGRGAFARPVGPPPTDLTSGVLHVLQHYRERLVDWDLGFREVRRLLDLYATMLKSRGHDVSAFVEAELKNIDTAQPSVRGASGWAVGSVVTILSGVSVAVLKEYQEEIVALLARVIGV
jgi:hypothetical protein